MLNFGGGIYCILFDSATQAELTKFFGDDEYLVGKIKFNFLLHGPKGLS